MKWLFISPKCNQGKCVIEEMHVASARKEASAL